MNVSSLLLLSATLFYYLAVYSISRADIKAAYLLSCMEVSWLQRIARVFVHNGLSLHATWTYMVLVYQLSIMLTSLFNLSSTLGSLFFYPFYVLHLLVSFSAEVCIIQFKLRAFFSQYIIYICAPLAGFVRLYTSSNVDPAFRELHLILLAVCLGMYRK